MGSTNFLFGASTVTTYSRLVILIPFRLVSDLATQIFVIVWIGAAVVTINSVLLGGKMYLQHYFETC